MEGFGMLRYRCLRAWSVWVVCFTFFFVISLPVSAQEYNVPDDDIVLYGQTSPNYWSNQEISSVLSQLNSIYIRLGSITDGIASVNSSLTSLISFLTAGPSGTSLYSLFQDLMNVLKPQQSGVIVPNSVWSAGRNSVSGISMLRSDGSWTGTYITTYTSLGYVASSLTIQTASIAFFTSSIQTHIAPGYYNIAVQLPITIQYGIPHHLWVAGIDLFPVADNYSTVTYAGSGYTVGAALSVQFRDSSDNRSYHDINANGGIIVEFSPYSDSQVTIDHNDQIGDDLSSSYGDTLSGQSESLASDSAALDRAENLMYEQLSSDMSSIEFNPTNIVGTYTSGIGFVSDVFIIIWDNSPPLKALVTISIMFGLLNLFIGRGARFVQSERRAEEADIRAAMHDAESPSNRWSF